MFLSKSNFMKQTLFGMISDLIQSSETVFFARTKRYFVSHIALF